MALTALAALVATAFAVLLVHHLLAGTLCCADDAFLAVAAKNLAIGEGYTSSYAPGPQGDTGLVRFDPLISTGPALILPAAAAIRILGNRYWVPGAVALAIDLLLLAAIFLHLAAATREPRRWAPAVAVGLVALLLGTLGHLPQWYALLGEIPALLLLCLGVLRTLDARGRRRDLALGGVLLGLAYLTKALALMAVPVVLAFIVLAPAGGAAGRKRLSAAAVVLAAFLVPALLFEAAKLADLGAAGYGEAKRAEAVFLESSPGSGLRGLAQGDPIAYVHETGAGNLRALTDYFGTDWPLVAGLGALGLGLAARGRWTGREARAPLVVIAIAAAYAAWWLPLSGAARIRYLLIGIGLACLGVVLDLFWGPWSGRKTALACALAAALLPRMVYLPTLAPHPPWFQPGPRTAAMLEAVQFLEAERPGRVLAADWWAAGVDVEYLLEGSGNVVSHLSLERRGWPPVLFVENAQWIDLPQGVRERWEAALDRSGAVLAFERPPYRIYAAPPLARPVRARAPEEGS